MKEQDIEKQLKESADNIKMKDFSERWEIIKERIRLESENQTVVPCEQKVAVTSGGYNLHNVTTKKVSFAVGLCCLFLAIVLAIVLPLVLKKNSAKRYFGLDELETINVSVEEFNSEITKSNIKVIDLSNYEINSCNLLYSEDNQLKGGKADLFDSENSVLIVLHFYSSDVEYENDIGMNFKILNVNSVQIKYQIELNDNVYKSKAFTEKNDVIYKFDCIAATDNINPVFEKLFG